MPGYSIIAGYYGPQEVFVAEADKKNLGQPKNGVPQIKRFIQAGAQMIINSAYVWGRRVVNGKPLKDAEGNEITPEVTHKDYRGDIEFLKWGNEKGSVIRVRYLPQSNSLDAEYQDAVQKIQIDKDKGIEDIFPMLKLSSGENKFDDVAQKRLVSFLKVHPSNRDSESKNPDPAIKGWVYFEVTDALKNTKVVKSIEESGDAVTLVKGYSGNAEKIKALFFIMGPQSEFGRIDKLSPDFQIYEALLVFADTQATRFLARINEHKLAMYEVFSKAKSYNALDLTKKGNVVFVNGDQKQMIWERAEGKNEEMLEWAISNFADPEVYGGFTILSDLVQKLK